MAAGAGAEAGADLLLFSAKDICECISGSVALEEALKDGTLDRSGYGLSDGRVLNLRVRLRTGDIGF